MNTFKCLECGEKYFSSAEPRTLKDSSCQLCGGKTIAVGPYVKLGTILLQLGAIDQDTLDAALSRQKNEKLRIGEILIEMGVVEPSVIDYALALQKSGKEVD